MLRKKWRVDEETLSRFKSTLEMYIGTHNFWNFTVGREFKEAASKRHIKSIEVNPVLRTKPPSFSEYPPKVTEPAIYGNTEWISVQIHGQSFMLHQVCIYIRPDDLC